MNPMFRRLPGLLDTHGVGMRDRTYVLALGVARAIAYVLPLPTTPAEVPMVHFSLTCYGKAASDISEINEQVVINTDLAMALTKKLWMLRYNVLHDMDNETARRVLDDTIELGSSEIPPNATELFRQYSNQGLFESICQLLKNACTVEGSPA